MGGKGPRVRGLREVWTVCCGAERWEVRTTFLPGGARVGGGQLESSGDRLRVTIPGKSRDSGLESDSQIEFQAQPLRSSQFDDHKSPFPYPQNGKGNSDLTRWDQVRIVMRAWLSLTACWEGGNTAHSPCRGSGMREAHGQEVKAHEFLVKGS